MRQSLSAHLASAVRVHIITTTKLDELAKRTRSETRRVELSAAWRANTALLAILRADASQARTEASPSPGQKYSLSTEILRVLMRTKAEDFAIGGKPEKMPIFGQQHHRFLR